MKRCWFVRLHSQACRSFNCKHDAIGFLFFTKSLMEWRFWDMNRSLKEPKQKTSIIWEEVQPESAQNNTWRTNPRTAMFPHLRGPIRWSTIRCGLIPFCGPKNTNFLWDLNILQKWRLNKKIRKKCLTGGNPFCKWNHLKAFLDSTKVITLDSWFENVCTRKYWQVNTESYWLI